MWKLMLTLAFAAVVLNTSVGSHCHEQHTDNSPAKDSTQSAQDSSSADDTNTEDTNTENPVTSCNGDPNAIAGCDKKCKKRCPGVKPKECKCPKSRCECKEGYLFNSVMYKCVKPDQCDSSSDDDTNSEGTSKENSPTSCNGDPNAIAGCDKKCKKRCPGAKPKECKCPKNSCECKEGYVYNSEMNKCVKPDKCDSSSDDDTRPEDTSNDNSDSCNGDPNAIAGCDKKCKKRCPGKKPKQCKCPKNSCECKEGYVYNSETNNCVKPNKCNKIK